MVNRIMKIEHFKKNKDYLICLDSDGTVFNSQEIKFRKVVIPCMIRTFRLEPASGLASETAEYVNLYSRWRGIGRYDALLKVFELLKENEEAKKSGFTFPDTLSLQIWLETEQKPCKAALTKYVEKTQEPFLLRVIEWEEALEQGINKEMRGIPVFEHVSECLKKASRYADIIVISSETSDILNREWEESGLNTYVNMIAGKEAGKKESIIRSVKSGSYEDDHAIMIGDAPGDFDAARKNNILFYPINPGKETDSWKRFLDESLDRFFQGSYTGLYQSDLVSEFMKILGH